MCIKKIAVRFFNNILGTKIMTKVAFHTFSNILAMSIYSNIKPRFGLFINRRYVREWDYGLFQMTV
jgi:uncharacterized membrane protein